LNLQLLYLLSESLREWIYEVVNLVQALERRFSDSAEMLLLALIVLGISSIGVIAWLTFFADAEMPGHVGIFRPDRLEREISHSGGQVPLEGTDER
jgi:hypothetical protein